MKEVAVGKLVLVLVLVAILGGVIFLAAKGTHDINQAGDQGVTAVQNSAP